MDPVLLRCAGLAQARAARDPRLAPGFLAGTTLARAPLDMSLRSLQVFLLVGLTGACAARPAPQETDGPEPDARLGEARSFATVGEAVNESCSTESVRGLSLQIIEQGNCIAPGAYAEVPALANFSFGENVFPFLEAPARDALVAAAGSTGMSITFNSMLRTVAQQYLLHRWDLQGRCGIAIAATPGNSNHETGLAFDTNQYDAWRSLLEANGFQWYGGGDPVHFDYVGPGAVDHRGVDVQAFQELWNRNHPDDLIDADGAWGPQTEARMQQAPAEGFPLGADCGVPPTDGPSLVPTVSAVSGTDRFTDGASASVIDVFEGELGTVAIRLANEGDEGAGGVIVGVEIDDPWLSATSYVIESDHLHPGEFEVNDANDAPGNPSHDEALPRAFELVLFGLSPGETKRITLQVEAVAASVQQGLQPGVRAWVKHIDGRYDQATFGGAIEGDGSQTFNAGRLEVALPLDVYSRTRWEFETDRREGWHADVEPALQGGALVVGEVVRSPALVLDGALRAVRLRASREGGDGGVVVHLLEREGDALETGEAFPVELDADGALHEVVVTTDPLGFVPGAIAIENEAGAVEPLSIDWIRLDVGDPSGDDDDDGDGEAGGGGAAGAGGDADGADDVSGGCACTAAGHGRSPGVPSIPVALGLLALAAERRRRRA